MKRLGVDVANQGFTNPEYRGRGLANGYDNVHMFHPMFHLRKFQIPYLYHLQSKHGAADGQDLEGETSVRRPSLGTPAATQQLASTAT